MTTPRDTHDSDPSPILASALPYPPEPSQSIMRHLLGF